jgi:hypothetical protein
MRIAAFQFVRGKTLPLNQQDWFANVERWLDAGYSFLIFMLISKGEAGMSIEFESATKQLAHLLYGSLCGDSS